MARQRTCITLCGQKPYPLEEKNKSVIPQTDPDLLGPNHVRAGRSSGHDGGRAAEAHAQDIDRRSDDQTGPAFGLHRGASTQEDGRVDHPDGADTRALRHDHRVVDVDHLHKRHGYVTARDDDRRVVAQRRRCRAVADVAVNRGGSGRHLHERLLGASRCAVEGLDARIQRASVVDAHALARSVDGLGLQRGCSQNRQGENQNREEDALPHGIPPLVQGCSWPAKTFGVLTGRAVACRLWG